MAIEKDVAARVEIYGAKFTIKRLAIHGEDIQKFKLPPLRLKSADTRSAGFRRKHGSQAVELDALPVEELRKRIHDAISDLIDHELWDRAMVVEKAEIQSITDFTDRWSKMTIGPEQN
jgi:hypothetical protein